MHYLKITRTLIVCLLLLTGCSEIYEEYGFKSKEKEFNWGIVRAKLIGNDKYYRNEAIRSSPYELFISIGSDTFLEGVIHISTLKLVNTKTQMAVFEQANIIEKSIQKDGNINTYHAYFSFKNIRLEYDDMLLQMEFTLKQGNKTSENKAEILFEINYRKFRRIIGV